MTSAIKPFLRRSDMVKANIGHIQIVTFVKEKEITNQQTIVCMDGLRINKDMREMM